MGIAVKLRGVAVIVVAVLGTLFISLGALLLVVLMRRPDGDAQALARVWGKSILRTAGVSVQREGGENLDPGSAYIFAANHQSQFDIFLLHGFLDHDFRWLAKKELFSIPLWGRAMRAAGYIPVDRSRGREALKSLSEAARKIASGSSVIIFPEGTRSADGRLQKFRSGAMQLAIKAGVPIVPVAISGTHDILPKGRLLARPGQARLRIGIPIETGDYGIRQKQELADLVHLEVERLLGGEG